MRYLQEWMAYLIRKMHRLAGKSYVIFGCFIRVLMKKKTYIGELVVNQKIADDVLEIMKELYENHYPIEKMRLIDEYRGR